VLAVYIGADYDIEKRRSEILESAKACDTGDGVIVLTMFAGTPFNLAISIIEQAGVEVLAGIKLPMLVTPRSAVVQLPRRCAWPSNMLYL
jgi:PTS system mannose-specific IIA component